MVWSSEGVNKLANETQHGREWSPYEFNGGTSLGICGDDFAVIAADTRLSEGYSILSRNVSKVSVLTDSCVVATGGCYTDIYTLHKVLNSRIEEYYHEHNEHMSTPALAQMLGNTLYGRRFFPYYTFNVVAGIDKNGKGAVYTYDAVGSFERVNYAAQGAGQKLIIPLLDNVVGGRNRSDKIEPFTIESAINIAKDAFITAGERDIYTGDAVEIFIITKEGVRKELFELKRD
jgi:20S proteasome subunit beta 6